MNPERDARQRREQRRPRRCLADALGDERARQLDDPRRQRREQSRLPGDARRIGHAGPLRQHLGRKHDEEDVREERDGVDAVGQRADVVASGSLASAARLDRVGDVADENRDGRGRAARGRRRDRAGSRARPGRGCRSGGAGRDCRARVRRTRRCRRERSNARREHNSAADHFRGFNQIGWTNAPLPAESQAANRTQALPFASNGMLKRFVPNALRSVADMIWRSTFVPSPQTTSANDSGNVHSRSAVIVRRSPVPSRLKLLIRISPVVTKKSPRRRASIRDSNPRPAQALCRVSGS